jgi:hypothetical protein
VEADDGANYRLSAKTLNRISRIPVAALAMIMIAPALIGR